MALDSAASYNGKWPIPRKTVKIGCPGTNSRHFVPGRTQKAGRGTFLGTGVPGSANVPEIAGVPGSGGVTQPGV